MRLFGLWLLLVTVALSLSCGKDHENLPTGFAYDTPPTPENVVVTGGKEECTIRWSYPAAARPSIEEFRVYEYIEAYDMTTLIGTTSDTVFVDSLLIGNLYYCFKISAVDTTGFEGWRTASACAFVWSAGRALPVGGRAR